MIEKYILIFSLIFFAYAIVALVKYYVPKTSFSLFSVFLFIFIIEISPVLVFSLTSHDNAYSKKYELELYEKCILEIESHEICKIEAEYEAGKKYNNINLGILFWFSIFIFSPIAGTALALLQKIKIYHKNNETADSSFLQIKNIIIIFIVIFIIFVGFLIAWNSCLPPAYINDTIKNLSLIIVLPFVMIIWCISSGFGQAAANSGKHSLQEALNAIIENDKG